MVSNESVRLTRFGRFRTVALPRMNMSLQEKFFLPSRPVPHQSLRRSVITRANSVKELYITQVKTFKPNSQKNISSNQKPQNVTFEKPKTITDRLYNDINKVKKFTDMSINIMKKYEKQSAFLARIFPFTNIEKYNKEKKRLLSKEEADKKRLIKSNSALSLTSMKIPFIAPKEKVTRHRSLYLSEEKIKKKCYDVYKIPNFLKETLLKIKDPKLQMISIFDKTKLIQENIDYFKTNYMFNDLMFSSFANLTQDQKAQYNRTLEEICYLLVKLPQILLKQFYDSLDQILYCEIPDLEKEKLKVSNTENENLKLNYKFFIEVTDFFTGCVEVLKVTKNKMLFRYTYQEFMMVNLILDLVRFDTSTLINFAKNYIERIKYDKKILHKFEEGLELREKSKIIHSNLAHDFLDRMKKKDQSYQKEEAQKVNRIINALDIKKKFNDKDFLEKNKGCVNVSNQRSLLNLSLITEMMKYIRRPIREKIIAQRVVERYKDNEIKEMRLKEEKIK